MMPYGFNAHHPIFRGGDWWDFPFPSLLFDQDFGMGWNEMMPYWHRHSRQMAPHWASQGVEEGGASHVTNNKEKFQVDLNVSHFSPEEIKVTTRDKELVIEGNHEERMDQHGFVSRQFTRKYMLPKDVDPTTVSSSLSADGLLTVKAPKMAIEGPKHREIPIEKAPHGKPAVEHKK
jgi:crystallin alpha B